jgi:hypothetical protein
VLFAENEILLKLEVIKFMEKLKEDDPGLSEIKCTNIKKLN